MKFAQNDIIDMWMLYQKFEHIYLTETTCNIYACF